MNPPRDPRIDALLPQVAALLQRGAWADAAAAAERALARYPAHAELQRLHGLALWQLGRLAEARLALRHAEALAPGSLEVQCNLAGVETDGGDAEAAIARLRAALRRAPGHAAVLLGLGNALMAAARFAEARESFATATHGAPTHPGLRLNLAAAELELGHHEQALQHIGEALQLEPRLAEAHALRGHVLQAMGRHAEAAESHLRAERAAPRDPRHAFQAGVALDECGELERAAEAHARALELAPDFHAALAQLVFAKRRLYDWRGLDALGARLREAVAADQAIVPPFPFLAEETDAALQLRCARAFAADVDRQAAPLRRRLAFAAAAPAATAPIRVGFVSNGFNEHPIGRLLAPLLEALRDDGALEPHLFATAADDGGALRRRLAAAAALHDAAGLDAAAQARQVHAAGIEVLFDLRGYGAGANVGLFELHPAPVQVNWFAYPASSGAPWTDYLLADAMVLPPVLRAHFSEKVLRLPRCFMPVAALDGVAAPPPREACGLPAHGVVFASFGNSYKLTPDGFARFMLVLQEVPDGVLWLQTAGAAADARLREAAAALGVDPRRLVFQPRLPQPDYLARYAHVDLFLDTLPYNAHAHAADALAAGCPLLTRAGATFTGRVAASLVQHAGLPELVCADEASWLAMAVELGRQPGTLRELRALLRRRHGDAGLFDTRGFAADFRRAVQAIGARHRIGRPPADLDF
ncbi:tetratricopeptide repeat protein [Fulvimonas soli]|jgi:predicted O-linked N-acetylglucosamine transferase (SPINDLY family)|uniref:protein O-GlcNAc transferase n=1 Tax=Fulvimonas soli TaxID=155197 RepID=A0A316I303_9GAMM|nr:glycosyltransferase family 41 protein [Fulvimonas soli]PWK87538.1 putative O-linked N-acetylglucosamine transferase (SPINDLY family) [Fulvimonas soli]TNY26205.1 hypothetical protein BV497_09935 [Fulvimonas soli]